MQKLILGIGGFVIVLLIVGFFLPAQSRFVITADVNAHRATVFALINDMRRTTLWSRIAHTDANARIVYSGAARGAGSSLSWDGPAVGSGTQTITLSRPFDRIETVINAGEPGESRTWFDLGGGPGRTTVSWGFEHDYGLNLVGRYFGIFATGIIRRDYELGLKALKELAESLPAADFSDLEVVPMRVEALPIAYQSTSSPPESAAKSAALGKAYFDILAFMDRHALKPSGPPLSIAGGFRGARLVFDAAIPVTGVSAATPLDGNSVRIGRTFGGAALRFTHTGGYDRLGVTHRKITAYLAALGVERIGGPRGRPWESYVSDPAHVGEDELLTYIFYPVRDFELGGE